MELALGKTLTTAGSLLVAEVHHDARTCHLDLCTMRMTANEEVVARSDLVTQAIEVTVVMIMKNQCCPRAGRADTWLTRPLGFKPPFKSNAFNGQLDSGVGVFCLSETLGKGNHDGFFQIDGSTTWHDLVPLANVHWPTIDTDKCSSIKLEFSTCCGVSIPSAKH